jgi:diphthamide synthase (EF-2-diphthine--ammonia ligase)
MEKNKIYKRNRKGTEIKSTEKLIELMTNVIDAHIAGQISKTEMTNWLKSLAETYNTR